MTHYLMQSSDLRLLSLVYSCRVHTSMKVHVAKIYVIAVWAVVRIECTPFCVAVCTAFFVSLRAAPLPKIHDFEPILLEHICLNQHLTGTQFLLV